MNTQNINELLEKYWNAETSLEEEQFLASYFSGNDIAPDHVQYKPLFQFYAQVGDIKFTGENKHSVPKGKVVSFSKYASWSVVGIAASLLILVAVGVVNLNPQPSPYDAQFSMESIEVTEEDEALEITKDALAYLGVKWDNSSQFIKSNVAKMESVSILK